MQFKLIYYVCVINISAACDLLQREPAVASVAIVGRVNRKSSLVDPTRPSTCWLPERWLAVA